MLDNVGCNVMLRIFLNTLDYVIKGAKLDWDFQISDMVKNPDGTDV